MSPRLVVPVAAAMTMAGCFDSLLGGPCAAGFLLADGQCVPPEAQPDGGVAIAPIADAVSTDALVCEPPQQGCNGNCVDVTSDPDNCGACGLVCPSGICVDSRCVGELAGHIVAIGHDYVKMNAVMAHVLGNAVAMGARRDVGVATWTGSADPDAIDGMNYALYWGMSQIGRPWHREALPKTPDRSAFANIDVLVVAPQSHGGDQLEEDGAEWRQAIDRFLIRGGVVVILEGLDGVSYRFAQGAALYTAGPPSEVTGERAIVVDPSDAAALQILSPYLATSTSVAHAADYEPVIAAEDGGTIVFHLTRSMMSPM